MRGTKTSQIHDFWIFEPRGTLIYWCKYTIYKNTLKKSRKYGDLLKHYYGSYLNILDFQLFGNLGKGGRRKMMKMRLRISWKSEIWDQSLPENMKWFLGYLIPIIYNRIVHYLFLLMVNGSWLMVQGGPRAAAPPPPPPLPWAMSHEPWTIHH